MCDLAGERKIVPGQVAITLSRDDRKKMDEASKSRPALRSEVRIEQVIGRSIELSEQSGLWRGRCTNHPDPSASLYVHPERGFYHCFSCGRHGDAIRWVMDVHLFDEEQAILLLLDQLRPSA